MNLNFPTLFCSRFPRSEDKSAGNSNFFLSFFTLFFYIPCFQLQYLFFKENLWKLVSDLFSSVQTLFGMTLWLMMCVVLRSKWAGILGGSNSHLACAMNILCKVFFPLTHTIEIPGKSPCKCANKLYTLYKWLRGSCTLGWPAGQCSKDEIIV